MDHAELFPWGSGTRGNSALKPLKHNADVTIPRAVHCRWSDDDNGEIPRGIVAKKFGLTFRAAIRSPRVACGFFRPHDVWGCGTDRSQAADKTEFAEPRASAESYKERARGLDISDLEVILTSSFCRSCDMIDIVGGRDDRFQGGRVAKVCFDKSDWKIADPFGRRTSVAEETGDACTRCEERLNDMASDESIRSRNDGVYG